MERKDWEKRFDQDNKRYVGEGSILVLHEKHGDRYYSVPTLDALYAAALATVIERNEQGWFYEPDQVEPFEMKDTDIDALPESDTKEYLKKAFLQRKEDMRLYKEDLQDWNTIQQAIKDQDGRTAWQVMRLHKSYEYEDWNVERAIDASKNPLNKEQVEL